MLMGTENTMYKSKSLHIHRNNNNHILEIQNCKHTHCFLIHLNYFILFLKYQKHTNPWPNPERTKFFFLKKTPQRCHF
jgi:hypothetical protein